MDPAKHIESLARFRDIFPAAVRDVAIDDARWKPPPKEDGKQDWSILEICCHLADEEEFDFRVRLRSTLEHAEQPWPAIDPGGWPQTKKYNEQNLHEVVKRFVRERDASLEWLKSLRHEGTEARRHGEKRHVGTEARRHGEIDWSIAHVHPKIGPIRAGDLLAAWAAHDALHLRQIAKRMFQLTQRDAGEYLTLYAGEW